MWNPSKIGTESENFWYCVQMANRYDVTRVAGVNLERLASYFCRNRGSPLIFAEKGRLTSVLGTQAQQLFF